MPRSSALASIALPAVLAAGGCGTVPAGTAPATGAGGVAVPFERGGKDEGSPKRVIETLPNGLRVVLEENHAAPVVALQAWVGIGSADEPAALAGIAHVFEHMLFKGTKKRGVGRIAQEVEGAGGDMNAWTSFDETVYHLVMAAEDFDTGLDILADALQNSTFDPDELERERKVVLEEIKQGEDSPDRVVSQLLFRAAYKAHPYGRPVIGESRIVAGMSRGALVDFYEKHYTADKVTLVAVGDFDADAALRKVRQAFSGMRQGAREAARAVEPAQSEARFVVEARDVKETQLQLAFHSPEVRHEDVPALDLVAVILGQGDSSRLNLGVVRARQLLTNAWSFMFSGRDPGLLVAGGAMPPGRVEEALRGVLDEILRLAREEVSPEELAKAKALLESELVYDKETVQGYARKLGFFAAVVGDPDHERRYYERLRTLGPADLRVAAAKVLRTANLSVAVLVPEADARKRADRAARVDEKVRAVVAAAESRADKRFAKVAPTNGSGPVVRYRLPSGLTLLVLRDPSVPVVAVRGVWAGGLRYETPRDNGITGLLASLLSRGTKAMTAEEIMHEVEGMAGSLDAAAGRNSLALRAEFLSRHWQRGLELLADCVRNPAFDEGELDKERRIVLDEIRAQEDNLGQVAFQLFSETMWKKHPYRMDVLGTAESVSRLGRRRLVEFYRRHYPVSALTLAVVGDVEPERVLAKIQALFGDAPAEKPEAPEVAPEPARTAGEASKVLDRQQAHLIIGYPTVDLRHPDRFPLEILSQVLSGMGGRLFLELREKKALAYRVSAYSVEGVDPGYFAVYVATGPENLAEATAGLRAELGKVLERGVTADELGRAQRFLVGAHAISLQRRGAVASALAFHEAYGQGWKEYREYGARIRKVTLADVQRVARKYLDAGREVVALVRPGEGTPAARSVAAASAAARPAGRADATRGEGPDPRRAPGPGLPEP